MTDKRLERSYFAPNGKTRELGRKTRELTPQTGERDDGQNNAGQLLSPTPHGSIAS